MQAAFPLPVTLQPSVPITISVRQRPPPTISLSQAILEYTSGLRAPPIA